MGWNYETISDHRCVCGEGPLWDHLNKQLYWIDILQGRIYCLQSDGQVQFMNTGQKTGAIALARSGRLIAALKDGIYSVNFPERSISKMLDPEPDKTDNRLNEGKTDPDGRFWIGSMSDAGQASRGSLYTIEKDKTITRKLDGLSISNGLAWDADRNRFYHIDTPSRKVIAYDYDRESGNIINGVAVVDIDEAEGVPDGMTIDSEGMLWIAHWNGGRVTRWDPHRSKKIGEILFPVSKITSCIFGGDDLSDLYITSACTGLNEQELKDQPLAGACFIVKDTGVKGVPCSLVDDSNW